jgi:hypothetical protein
MIFGQTQQSDKFTEGSPLKDNKKNQSVFQKGFTIDKVHKPSKAVFDNKTASKIFFEESNSSDQPEGVKTS